MMIAADIPTAAPGQWRQVTAESNRDQRIATARQRVRARREHAESTPTPPLTMVDGEIWVRTDDGGRETLELWVRHDAAHSSLADIFVAGPDVEAAEAWAAIGALAVAQQWRPLVFSAFLGDEFAGALAVASDAERIATKMQRTTADAPAPVGIATVPLTEAEFAAYAARADRGYAEELLASGAAADMDAALAEAAESMGRLLPQGLQTPDQRMWSVRNEDGETVGMLWVHLQEQRAFIYDIEMVESARGRGYGTQTLRAAAAHSAAAGRPLIALNVFGQNEGARRLYTREGYVETEIIWTVAPE